MSLADYYKASYLGGSGGGSSGGGALIISANQNMAFDELEGIFYFPEGTELDKTYAEIKAAIQSGRTAVIIGQTDPEAFDEGVFIMPVVCYLTFDGSYMVNFLYADEILVKVCQVSAASENGTLIF